MQFNFSQRDLGFKEVILVYKKNVSLGQKMLKLDMTNPGFSLKIINIERESLRYFLNKRFMGHNTHLHHLYLT